jgi:hypothetical protein
MALVTVEVALLLTTLMATPPCADDAWGEVGRQLAAATPLAEGCGVAGPEGAGDAAASDVGGEAAGEPSEPPSGVSLASEPLPLTDATWRSERGACAPLLRGLARPR